MRRTLTLIYDADEPIYPFDQVKITNTAVEVIKDILAVGSRYGELRPIHPTFPPEPKKARTRLPAWIESK